MTFAIKLQVRTKRLGNSIFVKSNIKLFVEFTNGNLSRKFVDHGTFSFPSNTWNSLHELSHSCAKQQVKAWGRFFLQWFEIYGYTQFEMRRTFVCKFFFTLKLWPVKVFNRHAPAINRPVKMLTKNVRRCIPSFFQWKWKKHLVPTPQFNECHGWQPH